jgi:hypothetical protein
MIFVDGGGDSLILQPSDAGETAETSDPFDGGDAQLLEAVQGLPNIIQAIVAVGLDINPMSFHNNITMLRDRGAYYGRVHLRTGFKEDYTLDPILSFPSGNWRIPFFCYDLSSTVLCDVAGFLNKYWGLAGLKASSLNFTAIVVLFIM